MGIQSQQQKNWFWKRQKQQNDLIAVDSWSSCCYFRSPQSFVDFFFIWLQNQTPFLCARFGQNGAFTLQRGQWHLEISPFRVNQKPGFKKNSQKEWIDSQEVTLFWCVAPLCRVFALSRTIVWGEINDGKRWWENFNLKIFEAEKPRSNNISGEMMVIFLTCADNPLKWFPKGGGGRKGAGAGKTGWFPIILFPIIFVRTDDGQWCKPHGFILFGREKQCKIQQDGNELMVGLGNQNRTSRYRTPHTKPHGVVETRMEGGDMTRSITGVCWAQCVLWQTAAPTGLLP